MRLNKIILLVVLLFLFCSMLCTAQDFRQTNWGMSKEEVVEIEGKDFEEQNIGIQNLLGYEASLLNMESALVFSFIENKLFAAGYVIGETHTNENNYIDDYNKIKSALTEKYGKPSSDNINWKNDLYKNDQQDWGFAISLGHLEYIASWETETTDINLTLTGNNHDITLRVMYFSKEFYDWSQQKIKEESLDNL